MQTAEGFHCCSDEIFHLLRNRYISLNENSLTLFSLDRLHRLHACGVNVADHDLRAATRKQKRCGLADSTAPAGNKRNLSRKIERGCIHFTFTIAGGFHEPSRIGWLGQYARIYSEKSASRQESRVL